MSLISKTFGLDGIFTRQYIVNAEKPDVWERVPILPVLEIRPLPEHKLLVFSDFTGLGACGNNGLAWRSPRVCWDELKITKVTSETIEGTGYDPTNSLNQEMQFAVELSWSFPTSVACFYRRKTCLVK